MPANTRPHLQARFGAFTCPKSHSWCFPRTYGAHFMLRLPYSSHLSTFTGVFMPEEILMYAYEHVLCTFYAPNNCTYSHTLFLPISCGSIHTYPLNCSGHTVSAIHRGQQSFPEMAVEGVSAHGATKLSHRVQRPALQRPAGHLHAHGKLQELKSSLATEPPAHAMAETKRCQVNSGTA